MNASDHEDLQLLMAWRAGDRRAGNRLVRRHYHRVRHFFATKVSKGVDDLTQQTFLACAAQPGRIVEGRFVPYLYGVARNKLLHHLRSRYRHEERLDPLRPSQSDPAGSSGFAARGERGRALLLALRRLPLDSQIAVEMFYWEEMSIPEIAAVLDAPSGTIKARLARARATLRDHLPRVLGTDATRNTTARGLADWASTIRRQAPARATVTAG